MNTELSDNAKAILLLTAPLIIGKGAGSERLLSLTEYNKLARLLKECGRQPADLLSREKDKVLSECQAGFNLQRIESLLERGFLLSQAVNHWQERAIWVVSRADDEYPRRFRERLGANTPTVIYGCGNPELLENGGLAVVGSRHTSQELIEYAEDIGRLAADSGCAVISGAARGVDQAAMRGALSKWGTVAGVLSGDLEKESVNREHREMLMEGQLVLISPYDPKARFNVGNAMQRNKLIYALADAGLVIESDYGKGGTWSGAVEQLDKLHFVPVYTRSEGELSDGLKGIRRKGSVPWPNPQTPDEFRAVLADGQLPSKTESPQQSNFLPDPAVAVESGKSDVATQTTIPSGIEPDGVAELSASDVLFATFEKLIEPLGDRFRESDVMELLKIEKKQASVWLKRLEQEGKYQREKRLARYVRVHHAGRLAL